MKHVARTEHLLRWFLLFWLGLIYIWGLQLMGLFGGGGQVSAGFFPEAPVSSVFSQPPVRASGFSCILPSSSLLPLFPFFLFSGLMLCHACLYWFGLSGRMPRRWRFFYLAVQGLLVCVMSFSLYPYPGRCMVLVLPEDFLICLYLALIVGAISILDRANAIIAVVTGYIVLLVLNTVMVQSRAALLVSVQTSLQVTAQSSIWYAAMILFIVGYIIVYLKQLQIHTQLQVTHARLKASSAKIEELTLANERQRLARELHDTLAQGLAGVVMQLQAANTHLSHQRAATAQEIVQQAILCAREALVDARCAIDDLRAQPSGTSEIPVALQKEAARFTTATGAPCRVHIPQNLCVSSTLKEHLLGIVREGLANVARHAQARRVWVSLVPRNDMLTLEVCDDGVGFDPATANQAGHYGLIGVRERARLLGGQLNIRSTAGLGTSLQLHLPEGQGGWEIVGAGPIYATRETERENIHV